MNVAHFTFVLAAVVIVLAVCYIEHLAARSKRRIILVAASAALVVGVSFWMIDRWMVNKKAQLVAAEIANKTLAEAPATPKTLREFYDSDFRSPSRPAIVGRPVTFTLKAHPEKPVACDSKMIVDIETKTKIIAYYVPVTAYTREICEVILGDYEKRMADWEEYGIRLVPEGERPNEIKRFKDVAFTGQIYVYHESLLYSPDLDELSILYRKKGLDPHFRSIDYVAAKIKQHSQASKAEKAPLPATTASQDANRIKREAVRERLATFIQQGQNIYARFNGLIPMDWNPDNQSIKSDAEKWSVKVESYLKNNLDRSFAERFSYRDPRIEKDVWLKPYGTSLMLEYRISRLEEFVKLLN